MYTLKYEKHGTKTWKEVRYTGSNSDPPCTLSSGTLPLQKTGPVFVLAQHLIVSRPQFPGFFFFNIDLDSSKRVKGES